MLNFLKNIPTKKLYIITGILLYIVFLLFSLNRHSKTGIYQFRSELWADKSGYYIYLPATFVYGWDESKLPPKIDTLMGTGFAVDFEQHHIKTKYPYGTALLQTPFWLIAHMLSPEKDGFGIYYFKQTNFAAVFYFIVGIAFLFFYLRRTFSVSHSVLTCLFLTFGTGLLYYTTIEGAMSHVYSFAVFSALWYYITLNKFDSNKYYRIIAVLSALIFVIRPINIVFLLLILLLAGTEQTGVKARIKNLFHQRMWLQGLPLAVLIVLPQFIYNYYLTGKVTLDTYSNERFEFWASPKILQLLFSADNGLLTYYPMLFLVFISSLIYFKKDKLYIYLFWLIAAVYIYMYASWWSTDMGCGLGHRPLVDILPLIAVPVAWSLQSKSKYIIGFCYSLCGLFTLKLTLALFGCYFGQGPWDWEWFATLITNPIN